jgi:hypothetical protein
MRKLDFRGDWVATRRPQSSYPAAASTESFLSKGFVKELESTINSEVLSIKKQRETHLVNENDKYLDAWRKAGNLDKPCQFFERQDWETNLMYVRLSELRRYIDRFLWKDSFPILNPSHQRIGLSPSRAPTRYNGRDFVLDSDGRVLRFAGSGIFEGHRGRNDHSA